MGGDGLLRRLAMTVRADGLLRRLAMTVRADGLLRRLAMTACAVVIARMGGSSDGLNPNRVRNPVRVWNCNRGKK